jgi:large subunit ribosomal protein L3
MKTFFGYKTGMTQVWTKSGLRLPVTIVKASPMTVTQIKDEEKDGYLALQVDLGKQKKEIKLTQTAENAVGDAIPVDQVFQLGDIIQVTGVSKGRGFAGVMKRWGFKGGPKTHGQSDRWRAAGSIGQGTSPGRVHKGKKMAGHYGVETITVRNLQVVNILPEANQIWISGPVPGSTNGLVEIKVTKEAKFEGLREL